MHTCDERAGCYASESGRRVACVGRCAENAECGPSATVCEREEGGQATQREVGTVSDPWRVAGYDGEDLVWLDERRYLRHARAIRGAGDPGPLAVGPEVARYAVVEGGERLGGDGLLRLAVRELESGRYELWEGVAGGRFTRRPPPWQDEGSEERRVRLCDADGDAAAVAPDGALWLSTRGTDTWHRALPLDGPPELAQRPWPRALLGDGVECGEYGCARGLWVLGWGPASFVAESVRDFAPRPVHPETPQWRCEPDGAAVPQDMSDEALTRGRVDAASVEDGRVNVVASASRTVEAPTPFTGSYVGSRSLEWRVALLDATRAGARLVYEDRDGTSVTLLALSPAAPPRVLAHLPRQQQEIGFEPALVARDGATLAMLSVAYVPEPWFVRDLAGRLLRLAPGRPPTLASITLAEANDHLVGAYALGAQAGVFRVMPGGPVVGGAAGALPHELARAVRMEACGEGARGDFVAEVRITVPWSDERFLKALLHMRLDGDALCLARMTGGGAVASPGPGGITGVGPARVPVRCGPSERASP